MLVDIALLRETLSTADQQYFSAQNHQKRGQISDASAIDRPTKSTLHPYRVYAPRRSPDPHIRRAPFYPVLQEEWEPQKRILL